MKKWMIFVAGIVFGFVVAFLIGVIGNKNSAEPQAKEEVKAEAEKEPEPEGIDGLHIFDEPGDVIEGKSFKVFQVLAKDAALVHGKSEYDMYMGTVYLLVNQDKDYYYDDEIVKVSKDKVVRQVGIYRYITREQTVKTVPVIMIMDN